MSTENEVIVPEVSTTVVETVADVPAAGVVEEQPEFTHTYQPTDASGRQLGGVQVIKYRTQQELIEKLTNNNVELVRLNRDLNKKVRLGDVTQDIIPAEATKAVTRAIRQLSDDEKVQLSRDILDPEKFDAATDLLFETKVGAKPAEIRQSLNQIDNLTARAEADTFVRTTPEYYGCQENFETMTSWMVKNDLAPVRQNFKYAFETLRSAGLLIEAPTVREENIVAQPQAETPVNSQPVEEQPSRITTVEPPQEKRQVQRAPSGLTSRSATNGTPAPRQTLTLEMIDKMSAEEYKRRLKDPSFAKAVNELYAVPTRQA